MPTSKTTLKDVCSKLQSKHENAVTISAEKSLHLFGYSDVDEWIDMFLDLLLEQCSADSSPLFFCIERIQIQADFLTCISDTTKRATFLTILADLPSLESLTIISTTSRLDVESTIPMDAFQTLIEKARNLKELRIEDFQINATYAATKFLTGFSRALQNHPSIDDLALTNFFANDWRNVENDVLESLMVSISSMSKLRRLDVSGCGSHALTGEDVRLVSPQALGSIISNLSCLTYMQLSFLELNDDHFEAIANQLQTNDTIETLHLDYHPLGPSGFRQLMHALEQNQQLMSLSVRSLQDMGDEGGLDHVLTMFQWNCTLQTLSITTSPSQQAHMDLFLRMNRAGRKWLRDPSVPLSKCIDVLANATCREDVDVVRHLLQESPSLCRAAIVSE